MILMANIQKATLRIDNIRSFLYRSYTKELGMTQLLPDDVPDCMIFLLAKVYQKAHASFTKQLTPYGLTNMQHLVLESLWYKPGMTAAQMGKFLILDKATLSDVLDRMVKGGWIEKKPDEKDRRLFSIFTSKKADDLKQNLIIERRTANEDLMKGLSPEEKTFFRQLLIDIINKDSTSLDTN